MSKIAQGVKALKKARAKIQKPAKKIQKAIAEKRTQLGLSDNRSEEDKESYMTKDYRDFPDREELEV